MSDVKLFTATKAFILFNGKVLILRESSKYKDGSHAGEYDVVGGRIPPGERFDDSLKREVMEETGLDIKIGNPFYVSEHRTTARGEQWQIIRIFFEAFAENDNVILSEDHDSYAWIVPKEYKSYKLIENMMPVFEAYVASANGQ